MRKVQPKYARKKKRRQEAVRQAAVREGYWVLPAEPKWKAARKANAIGSGTADPGELDPKEESPFTDSSEEENPLLDPNEEKIHFRSG